MKICSFALKGYEGFLVHAETDIRRGIPGTEIIGLPDSAVKEAKERVRAAIKNMGFNFPKDRILINLTPAGLKKEGSIFDLTIALAILKETIIETNEKTETTDTTDTTKPDKLELNKDINPSDEIEVLALGELELSGNVRGVRGSLSALGGAYDSGIRHFIIPKENIAEAEAICPNLFWAVENLNEAFEALKKIKNGDKPPITEKSINVSSKKNYPIDFKDIKGQLPLKRVLEIAAAGRHNLFFFGPPGCGKTMASRALESILPPLTFEEGLQTSRIYSLKGEVSDETFSLPPFRIPHHSSSTEGIIGGGKAVLPGEASLAHNGVLFLDEAFEFGKDLLQNLREPLESKKITLARASQSVWYPANFQLVLAANVCPCGSLGRSDKVCLCSQSDIARYWKRLGGAVLDRIELRLPAMAVSTETLLGDSDEDSASVKARVLKAVEVQAKRYKEYDFRFNSALNASNIAGFCKLDSEAEKAFLLATQKLALSSRATHSILKVARTIADLAGEDTINRNHILEATSYRRYGDNDLYWIDI